jgi:excisionase family DNA binding protein
MPVPVCRTVQAAYDAGRADALADSPAAAAEVAARVAELITPLLAQHSTGPRPPLLTIAQAAKQLGMSVRGMYELVYQGHLASVEIPSTGRTQRKTRRIEQTELDAFIEQNRVKGVTTW